MVDQTETEIIDTIVRILIRSESVLFITGAGVSAESGIPTYRGIGGLYNVDTTDDGYPIEECLSATMLAENPALTWKYLAQIGNAVKGARHNRAHEVIAAMEAYFPRVWTLTQNVDGFHRAAGSRNLIEAHGNMHSLSCTNCSFSGTTDDFDFAELPPKCPLCQAMVRPDVVLFGELIDGPGVDHMERELSRGFDVIISVGTTSVFPYIQAPVYQASRTGAVTIEINPGETAVSHLAEYRLAMPAAVALDEIWTRYRKVAGIMT